MDMEKWKLLCIGKTHETKHNSIIDTFQLKQCNEAVRYLGVRLEPNGQMETEEKYRTEQAEVLAHEIEASYIIRANALILYDCIWIPQISYCLPITTLTDKQCTQVHKPILRSIISKLGYNKNMPRALVHSSKWKGGMGMPKISTLQGI